MNFAPNREANISHQYPVCRCVVRWSVWRRTLEKLGRFIPTPCGISVQAGLRDFVGMNVAIGGPPAFGSSLRLIRAGNSNPFRCVVSEVRSY
jgi:hypothetical protein